MTMPMRPYGMGLGYGMGNLGQENDYFGPTNPGHDLAQVIMQTRAAKRADEQAAALEKERQATAAWRQAQADRESRMDPINEAIARARLRGMGVRGPGEAGGGGDDDVQGGLPSAGIMAGSRSAPIAGVQGARNGAGTMPDVGNRTQGMPSGFMGPTGGAHTLPGAFNPDTGTHNRPDIDLGGGYSMPFAQTPEGRQGTSARELLESGLLPNMTPAAAMYLSQHPEHIAALISAERGRGGAGQTYHPGTREEWMADERFKAGLPSRGQEEKPEISLAGSMQDIDRQMPGRMTQAGRFGLAQRMTHKGFKPQSEPAMSTIDELAAALPDNHDPEKARQVFAKYGFSPATTDSILTRAAQRKSGGAQPKKKGLFGLGIGPL